MSITEEMALLLTGVDHERDCKRYQQGLVHTSPKDCDCLIRGIAEMTVRLETRIERLTDPHLDPRHPDAYTTRGRWAFQVAEVLARDVQDLSTAKAKLLEALEGQGGTGTGVWHLWTCPKRPCLKECREARIAIKAVKKV